MKVGIESEDFRRPAKLPEQLAESRRRRIAELRPGEEGLALASAMRVDRDGSCYLFPEAHLLDNGMISVLSIQVRCREDGLHVVAAPEARWERREIADKEGFLPVVSVTIAEARHG
jgi:hypothetical protein